MSFKNVPNMILLDGLASSADAALDDLIKIRRHLHANPELSFHEEKTAAFVSKKLTELGIPHKSGIGGHGIVADIVGDKDGKVVAVRGDMDALPITELNAVTYASTNKGVMHACGHDVHTTCILGAARLLQERKSSLKGTVRLIFQPAEERIPGGASLMIKDGALKKPDVQLIFGQHVYPDMEVGNVGFRPGMYMASADELYITIKGKGGHAGLPHKCIDTILLASHVVTSIQQLVSRRATASTPTVVSIGKFIGNGATNVIPDEVKLEGTIRTMNEKWRFELHQLLNDMVSGICKSMGGFAEVEVREGYPALINDNDLTLWAKKKAIELLGEESVHDLDLRMTAEDFSYFAQEIPACFYRLGTSNASKGLGAPLHTGKFDIDEDALRIGSSLMATLAAKALEEL
ncbi:M20 family metallopeptidase [Cryomorphaceae bacterium 1068]|nr:M20 family metallopeptidase [Cryomorphaceae bacterium 1068]